MSTASRSSYTCGSCNPALGPCCVALGCQRNKAGVYAPPSDSTFFSVLNKVDTHRFDRIVGDWLLEQELSVIARLAVDGKALQLLSAVTHRLRLTLAQVPIEDKSNELHYIHQIRTCGVCVVIARAGGCGHQVAVPHAAGSCEKKVAANGYERGALCGNEPF